MESRFDRGRQCAYKIVLDTVVTPGLVGLIAFGPLIVVLGLGICRGAKGQLVPVAVAADLPGYLVSLFFAFGDRAIDPTAWLLAGLVLGAAPPASSSESQPSEATTVGSKQSPVRVTAVATLVLVGVGGAMWVAARCWLSTSWPLRWMATVERRLPTPSTVKTFHSGGWSELTAVLPSTSEQNRRDASVPREWKSVTHW